MTDMPNVTQAIWLSLPCSNEHPEYDPQLTAEQVARAYGISIGTLRALADSGEGPTPTKRKDGSVVYMQSELIKWQRSKGGRAALNRLAETGGESCK